MSLTVRPTLARLPLRPTAAPARQAASTPAPAPWLATRQAPAKTMDEGIARLAAVEARMKAKGDRRVVFVSTYLIQLRAFAAEVKAPGHYANPAWMTRMVLDFVQRYLDALNAYDQGDMARVPAAWKRAFDRAAAGNGPVLGDLLLAMNAHINHDLPLSVAATGPSPSVLADYRRFNDVLEANINAVQDLVTRDFLKGDSLAAKGDRWLGGLDEALTNQTIRMWREAAWKNGVALATRGQSAYADVQKRANFGAGAIAGATRLVPGFLVKNRQL